MIEDISKKISHLGYFKTTVDLPPHWIELVNQQSWQQLDHEFNEYIQHSSLTNLLKSQFNYDEIEFIISIRDAQNPWEEDGIWHDDGSRKLAFSLSLTTDYHNIEGGVLEIRKKGSSTSERISPFAWGEVVIFATGHQGFEHKINMVKKGKRIIIAGWCS